MKTLPKEYEFCVFSEEVRRVTATREYSNFANYVGQDDAVEQLLDLVYSALSDKYHRVAENVMFAGPPSTGKTYLSTLLANSIGTPILITDASQINAGVTFADKRIAGGPDTLAHLIQMLWASKGRPLQGVPAGSFKLFHVPPMIIFIDETHGLTRKSTDALLKATERADGKLFCRNSVLDCSNVLFIGATTSWGKLHPAFQTRFRRIDLVAPTAGEVAKIVQMNTKWDLETCKKVVFYGSSVPREALGFARTIERFAKRAGKPVGECVAECAKREGIDQWGMKRQRIDILKSLSTAPDGLILRNLSSSVNMEGDEVAKHWLPPLMFNKPSLVMEDGGRYLITEAGMGELRKRNLI